MALFKIFEGTRAELNQVPEKEGYAYFLTDEQLLAIDTSEGRKFVGAQELNGYAADEIPNTLVPVEYGVATYAEAKAIYDSGRIPYCLFEGTPVFPASFASQDSSYFIFVFSDAFGSGAIFLDEENGWSEPEIYERGLRLVINEFTPLENVIELYETAITSSDVTVTDENGLHYTLVYGDDSEYVFSSVVDGLEILYIINEDGCTVTEKPLGGITTGEGGHRSTQIFSGTVDLSGSSVYITVSEPLVEGGVYNVSFDGVSYSQLGAYYISGPGSYLLIGYQGRIYPYNHHIPNIRNIPFAIFGPKDGLSLRIFFSEEYENKNVEITISRIEYDQVLVTKVDEALDWNMTDGINPVQNKAIVQGLAMVRQELNDKIDAVADNVGSPAETYDINIAKSGWVADTTYEGYDFKYSLAIDGITDNSVVDLYLDPASVDVALEAGVLNTPESVDGFVNFYSKSIPDTDMIGRIMVFIKTPVGDIIEGAGDMLASVYDPQGRLTDVFAYVDNAVGNIPTPDVSGQINTHNEDTSAHADIRTLANNAQNTANAALPKSGGTMTGAIKLLDGAYIENVGASNISTYQCPAMFNVYSIDTVGTIDINIGNQVSMHALDFTLASYGMNILLNMSGYGYTYASWDTFHTPIATGICNGFVPKVRVAVDKDKNRHWLLGEVDTNWGGYIRAGITKYIKLGGDCDKPNVSISFINDETDLFTYQAEVPINNIVPYDPANLSAAVPIEKGGTDATDAATARANLGITPANIGAATMAQVNEAIAAIPTPDVSGQIEAHNSSTTAHSDIRTLVSNAANAASSAQSTANEAKTAAANAQTAADSKAPSDIITAGTTDLTAGTSTLASGKFYAVY